VADAWSVAAMAGNEPGRRFAAFAREFLRTRREKVLARQTSRDLLRVYHEIHSAQPELSGVARYQKVVARQTGLDESGVRRILESAENSFASWPVERPLNFRDVVQYLVAHACLDADPAATGIRARLATIVAEEIPPDL
jgi:hypothetical protein